MNLIETVSFFFHSKWNAFKKLIIFYDYSNLCIVLQSSFVYQNVSNKFIWINSHFPFNLLKSQLNAIYYTEKENLFEWSSGRLSAKWGFFVIVN